MFKKQNGITLVALIITIIVMLILAGVSISLVLGNNGVITQAQNAEQSNVKGALIDAIGMANADIIASVYSDSARYPVATTAGVEDYIADNFQGYDDYTVSFDGSKVTATPTSGTAISVNVTTETKTLTNGKSYISLKVTP